MERQQSYKKAGYPTKGKADLKGDENYPFMTK